MVQDYRSSLLRKTPAVPILFANGGRVPALVLHPYLRPHYAILLLKVQKTISLPPGTSAEGYWEERRHSVVWEAATAGSKTVGKAVRDEKEEPTPFHIL